MTAFTPYRAVILALCLGYSSSSVTQNTLLPSASSQPATDNANPNLLNNIHRDFVQERVNLGACKEGLKGVPGCAETLATGTPLHIAIGSLAPQNGVAAGIAFSDVYHPTFCASWLDFTHPPPPDVRNACHWSLNMNIQGMASGNGSWSAGIDVTAARISAHRPTSGRSGPKPGLCRVPRLFTRPSATVGFHSKSDSLNRLYFYGLGPSTAPSDRADFGLTENITGVNAVLPVSSGFLGDCGITVLGEINDRFTSLRGSYGDTSPSIETIYTDASAPGLSSSFGYFQAGEGVRLIPPLPARSHLKLNYLANFQQFVEPSTSRYSFRRFTGDFNHRLVLYSKDVGRPPSAPPPPLPGVPARTIPPIAPTRDVTGSLTARVLVQESVANAGHVIPFLFDPTIGGSDLNGQSILASYPDYRFRAPNLLLLHAAFEHSLGKAPIGVFLGLDEAKVGLRRDDIAFSHLRHSYSAGATLQAGGLPAVYLLFAWGGDEGHHTIANINPALLGTTGGPSLF